MKRIVQILGPTGIGKSRMAVILSTELNGEVISADSVQVYKGFNIGSSKIKDDEKSGIPHHLIDILEPAEQFNVNTFLEHAIEISNVLVKRGKLPIVCGGTPLYLRAMIRGIFDENNEIRISREKLENLKNKYGILYMWERLKKLDQKYAEKIGQNDHKRIIRGLEIFYNSRIIPSDISSITVSPFKNFKFIRVGLQLSREIMYERINSRVDKMLEEGLLEEVMYLRKKYGTECNPMKAIGYKELNQFIDSIIDMQTAVELIKQHSRNFAKRQMSWFNREKDIVWFDPSDEDGVISFIKHGLNDYS